MEMMKYDELKALSGFFCFSPSSNYRKRIKNSLNSGNYAFTCFIEFVAFYLVKQEGIKDYGILRKIIFRYLVLILFDSYANKKYDFFYSNKLAGILKSGLTTEKLLEDFNIENENIWEKIYISCNYSNEFSLEINEKETEIPTKIFSSIKLISKIFYKQQSYFMGDTPLLNEIREDRDNIVLIDEIICEALNKEYIQYEAKKSFELTYVNDEEWRKYLTDQEHELANLKVLSFVLKEAILQNKTAIGDAIRVESNSYYKAILDITNGYYTSNMFVKYEKENRNVVFDYSIIVVPLIFKLNDVQYALTKNGIVRY